MYIELYTPKGSIFLITDLDVLPDVVQACCDIVRGTFTEHEVVVVGTVPTESAVAAAQKLLDSAPVGCEKRFIANGNPLSEGTGANSSVGIGSTVVVPYSVSGLAAAVWLTRREWSSFFGKEALRILSCDLYGYDHESLQDSLWQLIWDLCQNTGGLDTDNAGAIRDVLLAILVADSQRLSAEATLANI